MKVRVATVNDVKVLHQLHYDLNRHRHALQPKNFPGRSVDEEWILNNISSCDKEYLVLEVNGDIRGMALLEMKEGKAVYGNVRYRYLFLRDFMIDSSLSLQTYGHELFGDIRGMALLEMKEGKAVYGNVRYRYLFLRDFMIDSSLSLQTYGHELFKEIRRFGKKNFLSYIQLNELINDEERLSFFETEQLHVTQQTFKCAI